MDTKKTILIAVLGFLIIAIFIFRKTIVKLNSIQLLIAAVIAFILLFLITFYGIKHGLKEGGKKDIPINKTGWLLLIVYVTYPVAAIIFAAFGMEYITLWMLFFLFLVLGIYTIYLSKRGLSNGKMQTMFGYYDKRKNHTAFKIMITLYGIGGVIEIGISIVTLITLI